MASGQVLEVTRRSIQKFLVEPKNCALEISPLLRVARYVLKHQVEIWSDEIDDLSDLGEFGDEK